MLSKLYKFDIKAGIFKPTHPPPPAKFPLQNKMFFVGYWVIKFALFDPPSWISSSSQKVRK